MVLLEAKQLIKKYMMGQTELVALKGIDLSINAGEFVAITGSSGSGKSTLMHLLGCLDTPTSGSFLLNGVNIAGASRDELAHIRNRSIGFVFQKFHLLADLTALDNVALPCLFAGMDEAQARERAAVLLKRVSLESRMDHYPYQLSGGQQQRVAIARALVNNPQILLGDEPTGNLDVVTGDMIMDILTTLNREQLVTIILVTHEPAIAAKTKRVIELIDGKIVHDTLVRAI